MKQSLRIPVLVLLMTGIAGAAVPRVTEVDPLFALPGGEVVAKGENLDEGSVVKLFLTAGGKDIAVSMKEQGAEAIRFQVPADIDLGRYHLLVQTGGPTPTLMELPIAITVEDEQARKQREDEEEALRQANAPPPPEPEAKPEPQR